MAEDTPRPETLSPTGALASAATCPLPEPTPTPAPPRQLTLPQPELPLFQHRAVTPVATGGPMLSSAQALLRRDLWSKDAEEKPVFRRRFSQGRVIEHYITTADPSSQYPEALAGQAAWHIVEQFGIPTAYLHLVFAAHAAAQSAPWEERFHLQGSDLITTLGMAKRTDVAKSDKLKELAKQAELLGSVGVWVVWREGKRDLNVRASRMWDVAIDVHGHEDQDGGAAEPTELLLTVRPGLWTEKFLNHAGQDAGTALRQFGYLAQTTLRINPYQEELAAKLAVYLTIMSRLRATYRVQTLLEAVEPATLLHHAAQDRRRRYAMKRRWDQALLTLHEHGWQLTFDDTTYPMALRPDWARPEMPSPHLHQLPAGYWRLLLAARITLTPPEPIPHLLAAGIAPAARAARPPLPPVFSGDRMRHLRETRSWSQRDLAKLLDKSQTWVALVEKGQRTIQSEDQLQLHKVFGADV